MSRFALVGLAAALYPLAAWTAAPGFYDGIAPPEPYRWSSPPPQLRQGNQPPLSGQLTIKVNRGQSDAATAFTDDGQVQMSFLPGSFQIAPGQTSLVLTIKPVTDFPDPAGIKVQTNVYQIKATATLVKPANIDLRYSDQIPPPAEIYLADTKKMTWTSLGANPVAQAYVISAKASTLGYFLAGFSSSITPPPNSPRVGGGQTLPVVITIAILIVVLAGIPLAVLRPASKKRPPPKRRR